MKRFWKILLTVLFAVYLAVLLRITVFRDNCFSYGWLTGRVEWVPFVYLWKLIKVGNRKYFIYLFIGNLIWFLPLGSYLCCKKRPFWLAVVAGFSLSLLIEISQFILGSGVSEVEDLILNTCGAMLGYAVTLPFVKKEHRK